MNKPLDERLSMEGASLKRKLWIITALILVLPFSVVIYVLYANGLLFRPAEYHNSFAIFLAFVIVGAVLVVLHELFDKFITIAVAIKKASAGEEYPLDFSKGTAELRGISQSFNRLLKKYVHSTANMERHTLGLMAIKELTEMAGRTLDMDKVMNTLLDKAMVASGAAIGSVLLLENNSEDMRLVACKGLGSDVKAGQCIPIEESLARMVTSSKKYLLVTDIEADPRFDKDNDPKYGSPSFMCLPIMVSDRLIGVMNLSSKENGQPFVQEDVQLLTIMIGEIRFALENAQLHTNVKEHTMRLEERTVALNREIAKRKKIEKKLAQMAHIDELTGLPNRALFMDRLNRAMAQARRNKSRFALLFMDLNKFKIINDTLGHKAGDMVLQEVAGRLKGCTREMDTVARLGGDEFIMVLIEIKQDEDAAVVARKVHDILSLPVELEGESHDIGCSIGISIYPTDGEDADALLKNADAAMYKAKEAGSAYQFFSQ